MTHRLVEKRHGLLARPFRPKQGDESFLARRLVLADPLAGFFLEPLMIDEIVGDLESQTKIACIAAKWSSAFWRDPAHDRCRFERPSDQGPGLHLLKASDGGKVELRLGSHQIHHLAPRHTHRPGRTGKLRHQFGADKGIFMGRLVGEQFERQSVKRIPRQDGRRFVEGAMDGRLASPKIVIVHAGQIVVDQRINVDGLDRERDPDRPRPIDLEQVAAGENQHRANAFAAADRGISHRLVKPASAIIRYRQQKIEGPVYLCADFSERRLEDVRAHLLFAVERNRARRRAVTAELDLLDLRLGGLKPSFALLL